MKEIARRLVGNVWRTGIADDTGDSQPVAVARVPLSSAQLLALTGPGDNSGWVTAVAAPGTGKVLVPANFGVTWHYMAGATPYTVSAGAFLAVGPSPASAFGGDFFSEIAGAGSVDQATDQTFWVPLNVGTWGSPPGGAQLDIAAYEDQPLIINLDRAGSLTLGDGTLTISIPYVTVTL